MITLSQITSDIENLATSGDLSYVFRIEHEQVYYWINEVRAMLISQAIQKKESLSDVWIQSISCVEMIQVEESECCLVNTGCYVLRSVNKLPITIETVGDNTIVRVVSASGDIISKSNPFETMYSSANKYTSKKARWFLKNGYLYILNEQLIERVTVYGIFEDPTELSNWVDCSSSSCFDVYTSPYPVGAKMANEITNYIIKVKVIPFLKFKQDNSNDGSNDESQLSGNPT